MVYQPRSRSPHAQATADTNPMPSAHPLAEAATTELNGDGTPAQWQAVSFFTIDEHNVGQRLDNFLITRLKGVPKSRIYRLIREHEVRINKKRVKQDTRLQLGDSIRVAPIRRTISSASTEVVPLSDDYKSSIIQRIVYQQDGLIVYNKPAGIAVHGGSGVNLGLIESLRSALHNPRLELIHRIDKETSGILLVAEKASVLKHIQQQFREHTVRKTYIALVKGVVAKDRQTIDLALFKTESANGERRVRVDALQGKASTTHIKVIQRFKHATLIEASPVTGRTHQIRVHCQAIGHPLLGDDKYGHTIAAHPSVGVVRRLCLHAQRITVPDLPVFSIDLPSDMQSIITHLTQNQR